MTEVKIKYFDTVPVCTSICVLKTGFLFAACEAGNHALYQFVVSRRPSQMVWMGVGRANAGGLGRCASDHERSRNHYVETHASLASSSPPLPGHRRGRRRRVE